MKSSKIEWEVFSDGAYYDLWCVRPVGDCSFGSPRSFHFQTKVDAEKFKSAVEKAFF